MSETQKFQELNQDDLEKMGSMRRWMIDHYEDATAYESVSGKLHLIQTILNGGWIDTNETLKLHSLGISFGDALEQEVPELKWISVDDEYGRDTALRWGETSVLIFPITVISKRIEEGKKVDVFDMFGGFLKSILEAVHEAT